MVVISLAYTCSHCPVSCIAMLKLVLFFVVVLLTAHQAFALDLSAYKQTTVSTGQFLPLSALIDETYYTITSKTDKVIATVALKNQNDVDEKLQNIHVYDGDNYKSAKWMGTLKELGFQNKISSSGKSLTLVNSKNISSELWVIGNDALAISDFENYVASFTSFGEVINWDLEGSENGSAYTFYCVDCDQFHWTKMKFEESKTEKEGTVSIQGMAPTQGMKKWVNYDYGTFNQNQQLPQPIAANMFTVSIFNAAISMKTTTSNDDTIVVDKNGRKLLIVSPSLWATGASPAFDYHFESKIPMHFSVHFQSLVIASPDGFATVLMGSETHRFNSSLVNPTTISGNGTVFRATYTGTNCQSGSVIGFEMNLAEPSEYL